MFIQRKKVAKNEEISKRKLRGWYGRVIRGLRSKETKERETPDDYYSHSFQLIFL